MAECSDVTGYLEVSNLQDILYNLVYLTKLSKQQAHRFLVQHLLSSDKSTHNAPP